MKYTTIIPNKMTQDELRSMCSDLQTAINWGLKHALVELSNGQMYMNPTNRLKDYQKHVQTHFGKTLV